MFSRTMANYKNMKIIIPVIRYYRGTAAMNRLIAYSKGFAQQGADVWFYFFITNANEEKLSFEESNIHVVNLWESDSPFWKAHRLLEFIKNLLLFRKRVNKRDVLFIYGRDNYMLTMAKSLSKKAKLYCEITEHPEYRSNSALHSLSVRYSLFLLKKFQGLFVISTALEKYFISKGIDEQKVEIINMFVDASRFDKIVKNPKENYVAYCGYVSKKKDGVDLLIKSFAIFYKRHKDYKLYIIGKGGFPEPLSYFENLAAEEGVKDNVIFTGEVTSEEMPSLLKNASILALSRPDSVQARNGFPTKLGEYLATGNPVVVTNVGEIPLFIKDKYNGIIANESDVVDFAEKLVWVADNPKEAHEIGLKGKDLVNSEFSNIKQSEKVLSYINHNFE